MNTPFKLLKLIISHLLFDGHYLPFHIIFVSVIYTKTCLSGYKKKEYKIKKVKNNEKVRKTKKGGQH